MSQDPYANQHSVRVDVVGRMASYSLITPAIPGTTSSVEGIAKLFRVEDQLLNAVSFQVSASRSLAVQFLENHIPASLTVEAYSVDSNHPAKILGSCVYLYNGAPYTYIFPLNGGLPF